MRDDLLNGAGGFRPSAREQPGNRGCGELRHGWVEEVAQFAIALLKAQPVAVGREVQRVEAVAAPAAGARRAPPDGRRRAIAEEARADDHAGIVVEVEDGGADFDGDASDGGARVGREDVAGGAERRNRGAAAETDEVLEKRVGAQAELLGDVAGEAGAEIAGAGADEEGVELIRAEIGLGEGGGERAGGEGGAFGAEDGG